MSLLRHLKLPACVLGLGIVLSGCTQTYSTEVSSAQKISETNGNFTQTLNSGDQFGTALANLGDLNLDGIGDIAVGATARTAVRCGSCFWIKPVRRKVS